MTIGIVVALAIFSIIELGFNIFFFIEGRKTKQINNSLNNLKIQEKEKKE